MSKGLRLSDFDDAAAAAERLRRGGLSPEAAEPKAKLMTRGVKQMKGWGIEDSAEVAAFFVPGRIEVLGKHTDYAGGRSIVAAVERGVCLLAHRRTDRVMRICALGPGETVEFELDEDLMPEVGHWSNYPMTVARRVARNFEGELRGADIVFDSDLPVASGMSSSSALIVAMFLALDKVNGLSERDEYTGEISTPEDLAEYLGTIENGQSFGFLEGDRGVGTFGGSEDHMAILCCQCGVMNQYSYCPVRFEKYIQMPHEYLFAIASSGVAAEKTRAAMEKYNRAARRAAAATQLWQEGTGRKEARLATIIHAMPKAALKLREILEKSRHQEFSAIELMNRVEHFLMESEHIIPAASAAMANGDFATFGGQVDRSQQNAQILLGNQIPETADLAMLARQCGAVAACSFGAGFGGSVWAMVQREGYKTFLNEWWQGYKERHPKAFELATFFVTAAGPAAFELKR